MYHHYKYKKNTKANMLTGVLIFELQIHGAVFKNVYFYKVEFSDSKN